MDIVDFDIHSKEKMTDGLTNNVWLINKAFILKEYNSSKNLEKDFYVLAQFPLFEAARSETSILMRAIPGRSNVPFEECIAKHGLMGDLHEFHHNVHSSGEHIVRDVIGTMIGGEESLPAVYNGLYESLHKEWADLGMDRHLVSIHCDVRSSNIIVTDNGCQLIDFEYCCQGHPAVDIGNMLCELYSDYDAEVYSFDRIPSTEIERFARLYNEVAASPISSAEILVGIKTSRLLWAVWGRQQMSNDDFDYLGFSQKCVDYLLIH